MSDRIRTRSVNQSLLAVRMTRARESTVHFPFFASIRSAYRVRMQEPSASARRYGCVSFLQLVRMQQAKNRSELGPGTITTWKAMRPTRPTLKVLLLQGWTVRKPGPLSQLHATLEKSMRPEPCPAQPCISTGLSRLDKIGPVAWAVNGRSHSRVHCK